MTACSNSGVASTSKSGGSASAPGVTKDAVTVATIATLTGPVPGLFKGAVTGVQAYFDYVNSQGGVNGRTLKVKAGDDAFNCAQEASQVSQLAKDVFAFVGSFTLSDDCGVRALKGSDIPWVAYGFGENLKKLPAYFSPAPNFPVGFTTGPWPYLQKTYGVSKVGFLYSATGAVPTQKATMKAMESTGLKVAYQRGITPTDTSFSADVQRMKSAGVDYIYADMPPTTMKVLLTEIRQADFHPKLISDSALYGADSLQQLGDPHLADGVIGTPGFGLFLSANSAPGIALMNEWVKKVPGATSPDLYTVYGWASAKLFVDGLKAAGSKLSQQSFLAGVKGIHEFDTGGLLPTVDAGARKPSPCWVQYVVKNGTFEQVHPASGFDCSGTYLLASS
jgi:ABC-type branched-subunit amino acid transport system substrate-binding protein